MTDEKTDPSTVFDPVDQIRRQAQQAQREGRPRFDPYLHHRIQQAMREEHARCMEDYKDHPLPQVIHLIKQRAIAAKDRAIAEHHAIKAKEAKNGKE